MRTFRIAAAALLATFAGTAFAMDARTWDFRGQVPVQISVKNLGAVEPTAAGLSIRTGTDGFMLLPPLTSPADVLHVQAVAARPVEASVLWQTPGMAEGEYYQSYFVINSEGESVETDVVLHQISEWTWSASTLGIAFPAGTNVVIERMEWRSYSFGERLVNGFISFWTPDEFRMYSINFLWGPLIGSTPEARTGMFDALPPRSWSATRIFYGLFAAAAVVAGLLAWANPDDRRKRFLMTLAFAGGVLWIAFDVRMTQEIFSYVAADWSSYVLADEEDKVLRTHSDLYSVLKEAKELLGDDDRYVLVTEDSTPFFANVRYVLYPATPLRPGESAEGIDAYIVLARPDVGVENGNLGGRDGLIAAGSGAIVHRFDESSFFYRLTP